MLEPDLRGKIATVIEKQLISARMRGYVRSTSAHYLTQDAVLLADAVADMLGVPSADVVEPPTAEQQARDMLERMGVPDAQSYSSGDLVELANLIARSVP